MCKNIKVVEKFSFNDFNNVEKQIKESTKEEIEKEIELSNENNNLLKEK